MNSAEKRTSILITPSAPRWKTVMEYLFTEKVDFINFLLLSELERKSIAIGKTLKVNKEMSYTCLLRLYDCKELLEKVYKNNIWKANYTLFSIPVCKSFNPERNLKNDCLYIVLEYNHALSRENPTWFRLD